MFDEFLSNYSMEDEIKPSRGRVKKNIAALRSLIETEESTMTKRRFKFKPLIIAAAVAVFSMASLITVNAAMQGAVVEFLMGGKEIEGEYYDYVDGDGYRHVSFGAVLPLYENNFAIIYDVDAPKEEAVRIITEDTDPDFLDKIRLYNAATDRFHDDRELWYSEHGITWDDIRDPESDFNANPDFDKSSMPVHPDPEDFGLIFKDSELCSYNYRLDDYGGARGGQLGGKFMHTGIAEGHPSGGGGWGTPYDGHYDYENETITYNETFYYYVGIDESADSQSTSNQ